MYHSFFTHLSVDGHLGCVCFLAIVNTDAMKRPLSHSVTALFSLCLRVPLWAGRLESLWKQYEKKSPQTKKRSWHDCLEQRLCVDSRWSPREAAGPRGEGLMVPFWRPSPGLLGHSPSKVFCVPRQPQSSRITTLKGMMQKDITSCNP